MSGALAAAEEGSPLLRRDAGLSAKRGNKALAVAAGATVLVLLTLQLATRLSPAPHDVELMDANKVFESNVNVMPTRTLPAEAPVYPGVTDADQSPEIPEKFLKEEEQARKNEASMLSLEERQQKREEGINARVNAISAYVNDEVSLSHQPQQDLVVDYFFVSATDILVFSPSLTESVCMRTDPWQGED